MSSYNTYVNVTCNSLLKRTPIIQYFYYRNGQLYVAKENSQKSGSFTNETEFEIKNYLALIVLSYNNQNI